MTTLTERAAELSAERRADLARSLRERLARDSATRVDSAEPKGGGHYDVAILGGGVAGLTLALQLRKARPDIRIVVVERQEHPVPETTHKVGESTVEIAAHYLRDILGLHEHLETRQLRKFGLRMFFSDHDNTDIGNRAELGSSVFPPLRTYQLDRGRLENELGALCIKQSIDFLSGSKVLQVDIESEKPNHQVRLLTGDGERDIRARWLVDATGRSRMLQRQLGLQAEVGHVANASWWRIAHPIDLGTWTDDSHWKQRITEGDRALSTNHLMGPGYWVWLIRLSSGSISIGIVADADTHPFSEFNTLERARDWLRHHEPQCGRVLDQHIDKIQDFRVMKNYAYSCRQLYAGDARWCLTGEAGVFLDPLYSPGLDLIAIGNGLVVDLVTRSLDGQDVTALARLHDTLFRRIAEIWLAIYEKQYVLMGNAQVMTSKVIWDTAFYWGVFGLLFFNDKFRSVAGSRTLSTDLGRLTDISNRVQAFFREWESIDDSETEQRFVDLYSPLNFMVKLHNGMADELSDAEFEERFSANTRLFAQLAGQLISKVIEAYADRFADERVIAQIQSWQQDPLIVDLLTTYRRERHRNPTSEGWLMMRPVRTNLAAASPGRG